ncbi:MAG: hypothetical protein JWL63_2793 [Rhodocyclales bacterium]|nr:hypothetical protein [Rhodocyclales bacterium]
MPPEPAAAASMAEHSAAAGAKKVSDKKVQRHIALRHQLVIETRNAALQSIFEEAVRRCEQLGCEVPSAGQRKGNEYEPPSASLTARIPPAALDAFLAGFGQDAEVVQHSRQSEDKTNAVIDTEARLRNLNDLRERLRTMLASHPGKIADVLEIQRELTQTQAELDSLNGIRKALADETEKIALSIDFRGRASMRERGFLRPVASAWNHAGETLMSSLASLITFIAAVLPWLVILVPGFVALRKLWRRWKARRAVL